MLTPLDIQNKEFGKGFRGYVEIEVDSFLDQVITDYEHIFRENLELKNKLDLLHQQIDHYDSIENTLQKTLVVAQTTADQLVHTAKSKGDAIIEESNLKAEKIIKSARDQVIKSKEEYESIRKDILLFRTKYKSMLNSQLEAMDHYCEGENTFSILKDMKNIEEEKIEANLEVVNQDNDIDEEIILEQKEA